MWKRKCKMLLLPKMFKNFVHRSRNRAIKFWTLDRFERTNFFVFTTILKNKINRWRFKKYFRINRLSITAHILELWIDFGRRLLGIYGDHVYHIRKDIYIFDNNVAHWACQGFCYCHCIHSPLSWSSTARGSYAGHVTVGPTKV